MAQLRPNLFISDLYGSAGAVTAYHRGGKCFFRKRITPAPAGTGVSLSTSVVHLRALQAWRSLPQEEQILWEPFAQEVEPHRPPFDHKARISGNNLFISAYHGFATLGVEHIPVPRKFEPFPSFIVGLVGASVVGENLLLQLQLETEDPEGRYRLLAKVQLTRPGGGRNPGAMRNFLADGTARSESQTVAISSYKSIWGLELDSYQVHARCILLDTETGYRSQFVPVSGVVSL